jgi:hypothetical protein
VRRRKKNEREQKRSEPRSQKTHDGDQNVTMRSNGSPEIGAREIAAAT